MVTIALGGDTMLGRMVGGTLAESEPQTVWDPVLRDVFAEADFAVVNLECCISEDGRPSPGRRFHFRAPPAAVEVLAAAGVKAVWLANNHALDYGAEALLDTFDHLRAGGIGWAGAGIDEAEARRGIVVDHDGTRIGLIGFADHPAEYAAGPGPGTAFVDAAELACDGPPTWLLSEVRRLAEECTAVVVGPHWGPNMNLLPQAHHPAAARALVRAGATLIAGHSAHCVQPLAVLDGAPVLYDLGDLLDDYALDQHARNDLGLLALYTPSARLELVALRLEFTRTGLATGDDRDLLFGRLLEGAAGAEIELRPSDGRLVLDLGHRDQSSKRGRSSPVA